MSRQNLRLLAELRVILAAAAPGAVAGVICSSPMAVTCQIHSRDLAAMIPLQKLFGKDDRFFALLEASAGEARQSV